VAESGVRPAPRQDESPAQAAANQGANPMTNRNDTATNVTTTTGTNTNKKNLRKGFTLIEILIVVVILGVLAALVVPSVTGALDDANNEAAEARGGQITTMVTRLNQFQPNGDNVALTDGAIYTAADLQPLVDNGYCSADDLVNQVDSTKGWTWSATTRRFTPEP
jgi:prepilin-type N-terminal cleavage/methylation domain-containing protein